MNMPHACFRAGTLLPFFWVLGSCKKLPKPKKGTLIMIRLQGYQGYNEARAFHAHTAYIRPTRQATASAFLCLT